MIELKRYLPADKPIWDKIVSDSKTDSFLFYRDYMDYHADRFNDFSFIAYKNQHPEAVIPGNISGNIYYSHQGLTYGGLIMTKKAGTEDVLAVFDLLIAELKNLGIKEAIYKPVPYIYQLIPSQEEIFALYKHHAVKTGCNISSTIFLRDKIAFTESRKSGIRKSQKEGVIIEECQDFVDFWELLKENLKGKHATTPVHTADEMHLLKKKFPENIVLFGAKTANRLVGGAVLYVMKKIVHVQYIAASDTGKKSGALDLLFDELINKRFSTHSYFDFGHSTEQMGNLLNKDLLFQKEGFGGRGVVYDIYKFQLV
ncbi:MAG TPA: GNAT family N-acetyltransferase [Bacteroidales bacterium]|nr:GNAT family N-acetyltransferase [Bacteroidales bacterium]